MARTRRCIGDRPGGQSRLSLTSASPTPNSQRLRELFYVDGRQNLVAARVNSSEGRFVVEGRETLFAIPAGILFSQLEQYALYDVSTDDERFLMLRSVGDVERTDEVILVQNWVGEVLSRLSN